MIKSLVLLFPILSLVYGGALTRLPPGTKIVGGEDAPENRFPYQISLRYYGSHNCGGSILNFKWVLTAGHCVDGYPVSSLTVVSGSIYLSSGGVVHNVVKAIVHPDFDIVDIKNDLAVIKIDDAFTYSPSTYPIDLESKCIDEERVVVSGWGRLYAWGPLPDRLQFIELKSLRQDVCQSLWSPYPISDGEICTLTVSGEGVCNGDSGSPLTFHNKLIGIVSWGNACANGIPDVYTRISKYWVWILDSISC